MKIFKYFTIVRKAIYYRIKFGKDWMKKLEGSGNYDFFYDTFQKARAEAKKRQKNKPGPWHVIRFADRQYAVVHKNYLKKRPDLKAIYSTS